MTDSARPAADMTIEELAERTGLSVRNIRSHRTSGLLPPPEVRNTIGYYGEEHLSRLLLIKELQADGFNLQAIKRLIDATHAPASMLRFRHVLFAPIDAQPSAIMSARELLDSFGEKATQDVVQRAIDLGELVPLQDGRIEVTHPTVLEAVRELARQGMDLEPALDTFEDVRRRCEEVADVFVELIYEGLWQPFVAADYPEDRWVEMAEAIRRLRPIASQVLLATFQTALERAIERIFGQELERLAGTGE